MGYYTSYELSCNDYDLIKELRQANDSARWAIEDGGGTQEACKWYEHENDLLTFSKLHPLVLFTLSGEGEEAGDMWKKYFLNGKMQTCKAQITYEGFNQSKLK